MRKKIALINQRYGLEVNGGSEYYTRLIAERLTERFDVDVITTKALDYTTWKNHYTADKEIINGVRVLRFSTDRERAKDFGEYNRMYLTEHLSRGKTDIRIEKKWFDKQGPFCPKAVEYIKNNKDKYDCFIFVTYLYYLTVNALPEVAEKSVLIPTAHEEPSIHFEYYQSLFNLPQRFIFLTDEEKELVHGLFNNSSIPYDVMGVGIDIPENVDEKAFRKKYGVNENYFIYVGRIDEGKNCHEMFKYFMEYKRRFPEDSTKLVLMGKAVCEIPNHADIISLGFVSEEDKFNGISGARALILPSKIESLSIAVLEAMSIHVPVVVNGRCEVLKGHCLKSNAGLYYTNYFEFEGVLNFLLSREEEYNQMRLNARDYIDRYYRWEVIMDKFSGMIEGRT